jgi:hypothetical protein
MGERGDGGTGGGGEGEEARTLNRSSILCNLWVCPPNTYIDLGDLHLNRMLRSPTPTQTSVLSTRLSNFFENTKNQHSETIVTIASQVA